MSEVLFVLARSEDVPQVYGGEKSTIATALGLAQRGFRPKFLITRDDDLARELARRGLAYEVIAVANPFEGLRSAPWGERFRKVRAVLAVNVAVWRRVRGEPAIVHSAAIPAFYLAWLGAWLGGAKTVYHVRTASRAQRTRWFEEAAILLADRTIAVSDSLRAQLIETGHGWLASTLGSRIDAIPNGFEFARLDEFIRRHDRAACRAATGPDPGEISLLLVGSVFADKGQLRFIERVLPIVLERVPSVRLSIVGGIKDPAYRAACDAAAARRGVRERVTFVGYVPEEAVYRWYRGADIAVLPSEREGLPRCAIEAQAFGLPVVATDVVGSRDAIRPDETGFLAPNDRIEDMIEPLVRLARDAELRGRMGHAGAAWVRSRFSLERNVEAIRRLYDELLSGSLDARRGRGRTRTNRRMK